MKRATVAQVLSELRATRKALKADIGMTMQAVLGLRDRMAAVERHLYGGDTAAVPCAARRKRGPRKRSPSR